MVKLKKSTIVNHVWCVIRKGINDIKATLHCCLCSVVNASRDLCRQCGIFPGLENCSEILDTKQIKSMKLLL